VHDPPGLLVFFQFNSLLSDTPISLVQAKWPTAYLGAYITANPLTDERQEKGKSNPPAKLERDELLRSAAAGGRAAAARVPGEGRVPAAGVPAGRLPTAGAGVPSPGIPSAAGVPAAAGLPAAVRAATAAAAAAAPQQRAFLHGGMVRPPPPPLSPTTSYYPRQFGLRVSGGDFLLVGDARRRWSVGWVVGGSTTTG
jgi:hypothetical protein